MDERASKRISKIVKVLIFICMAFMIFQGCKKNPYQLFVSDKVKFIFTCEIPSDWEILSDVVLHMVSPKDIEYVSASISISGRGLPLKNLIGIKQSHPKRFANDPYYKQTQLKPIKVGKFKAITYSEISEHDSFARESRHVAYGSLPNPVILKETYIYFEDPGMNYYIKYAAPISILNRKTKEITPVAMYDEYLPVLAHLLGTFGKIEKGTPEALKVTRPKRIREMLARPVHFLIILFFLSFFIWSIKLRKKGKKVFHWFILIPILFYVWDFIITWYGPPDVYFVFNPYFFIFFALIGIIPWLLSWLVVWYRNRKQMSKTT